jgi:hypothetical protein
MAEILPILSIVGWQRPLDLGLGIKGLRAGRFISKLSPDATYSAIAKFGTAKGVHP